MVTTNRLHELYASLQSQLAANLDAARKANKNPNAKGDESERKRHPIIGKPMRTITI